MDAEIYSKTNCGYCDRAKLRLAKYNPKIYMLDTDYTREDFFEKRVSEYQRPTDRALSFDEAF